MKPHKHAEVIKAWADGKECEYYFCNETTQGWVPLTDLRDFHYQESVRIKPEPKLDWTEERILFWNKGIGSIAPNGIGDRWLKDYTHYTKLGNFKLTFDGETREVKLVELIK
jgi:hypothetical protein